MRKIASFLSMLTFAVLLAAPAGAAETKVEGHLIGKADAPVTIHEYSSLTCSHCGDFKETILPELKKRFLDTGKAKLIVHDFPTDGLALKAAALAECMPKEQYFAFSSILYKNLRTWVLAPRPEQILLQYAKLGGLSEERATACMNDEKLLDELVKSRTDAVSKYNIEATPTFVINDGENKIVGAQGVDAFAEAIEKASGKKH